MTRRIHSVYCTAKADDAALDRFFPELRPLSSGRIFGDDTNKNVFYLDGEYSSRLSDLPLSALAVPELSQDASTTFSASGPAAAFRALAPTTLFQLAGAGNREFERMAELVRSVPIYRMRISRAGGVAESVTDLLRVVAGVPT